MDGHSKWPQIKRKKGITDQKRGLLFTKLSRSITLAVLQGGCADEKTNVALRMAIDNAKKLDMPRDTINRAIEKASFKENNNIKSVVYEAIFPFGVFAMIDCTTDNPKRTVADIRCLLDKNSCKMAEQGSLLRFFIHSGLVKFSQKEFSLDYIMNFVEKFNAIEIFNEDDDSGIMNIIFPFEMIGRVEDIVNIEEVYYPKESIELDVLNYENITNIVENLEDYQDVNNIFLNCSPKNDKN